VAQQKRQERHAFDVLYLMALSEGLIDQSDLTSIFAAQMQKKLAPEQIRQFIAVLKKYPEPQQRCKDYINQTRKNLEKLSDL
jgi:hypothetical protein